MKNISRLNIVKKLLGISTESEKTKYGTWPCTVYPVIKVDLLSDQIASVNHRLTEAISSGNQVNIDMWKRIAAGLQISWLDALVEINTNSKFYTE